MNLKKKNKITILVVCMIVGVLTLSGTYYLGFLFSAEKDFDISLQDFSTGTRVHYEITNGNQTLLKGQELVRADGSLPLPSPKNVIDTNGEEINYKLKVEMPRVSEARAAETLDLLLGLNKKTKEVSVAGSGFDAFSDIAVQTGEKQQSLKTDWAGLFSLNSKNQSSGAEDKAYDHLQLAFQGSGLSSDVNSLGSAKMNVFLGDSSGSNINAVQVRYSSALIRMAHEMAAVMVMQTQAIGMFFDASIQMRTQRKQQELRARANKDYHPSDQMCVVGTFVRSLAHSESNAQVNKKALNKILMNHYLGVGFGSSSRGEAVKTFADMRRYAQYHCDPRDSGGAAEFLCPAMAASTPTMAQRERFDKDVDYTRTIGNKLTVDVSFTDGAAIGGPTNDLSDEEVDIIALAKNLYFPDVFEIPDKESLSNDLRPHLSARSYVSKMNVAHTSFLNLVGMKASAPPGQSTTATATSPAPPPTLVVTSPPPPTPPTVSEQTLPRNPAPTILAEDAGWTYMKSLMLDLGITPQDGNGDSDTSDPEDHTVNEQINAILGGRPSYYAQMEVLTKKIFQHPDFYTNLYDKPANVERIGASVDAITLMHQRDRFESMLRREMLTSVLVEEALGKQVEEVSVTIFKNMQNRPIR